MSPNEPTPPIPPTPPASGQATAAEAAAAAPTPAGSASAAPAAAPRLVVDVTIAAPPARVWQALRDPALLAQWFGWEYEQLAAEIDMIFVTGGVETELGRRLDMDGHVFELEPAGGGTRVRLVRSDPPKSDTWDDVYDDIDEGWRTFVAQLAFWLELQHGVERTASPRRTVYVAGHREQPDAATLIAAAGLASLEALPVGARYRATAATGEPLTGVIRFRTEHQLGVSVEAWGPGLLVLAGKPGSPASPHGGGFVLITAFGVDDDRFTRLRDGWADVWRAAFTRVSVMA